MTSEAVFHNHDKFLLDSGIFRMNGLFINYEDIRGTEISFVIEKLGIFVNEVTFIHFLVNFVILVTPSMIEKLE